MIRVDAVWLCTQPLDMRAGTDTTLARVVQVFGSARPHHAYLFANKRSTRLKVLVHDGIGIWLDHRVEDEVDRHNDEGRHARHCEGAARALRHDGVDAPIFLGKGGLVQVVGVHAV